MAEEPPVEGMVRIWGWHCERCGHEWTPRNRDQAPKVCPNPACKSPYWQTARRNPKV
jgi:hypothetical protein